MIIVVIQKEVAGSASGGCTYGTATERTHGGVRSRPTTEEEEEANISELINLLFTLLYQN